MKVGRRKGRADWTVDFYDQFGRRHQAQFATKREAEVYRDKASEDVRHRAFVPPARIPTFREVRRRVAA